jgi:hypothetical protein
VSIYFTCLLCESKECEYLLIVDDEFHCTNHIGYVHFTFSNIYASAGISCWGLNEAIVRFHKMLSNVDRLGRLEWCINNELLQFDKIKLV